MTASDLMRIGQRRLLAAVSALAMAMILPAALPGAQASPAAGIPSPTWQADCGKSSCVLQIVVPFNRGRGTERAALAIDVVPTTKRAQSIAIFLPADAVAAKGVIIGFVDAKAKGADPTLQPAGDLYTLPITECKPRFCVSRVQQMLDNDDGTFLDLLAALQRHSFLWVAFHRPQQQEPVRILLPTGGLRAALAKVMQGRR